VNNVTRLAEDKKKTLSLAKQKATQMDARALRQAVENYGGARAKRFFFEILEDATVRHA
jgi:hypothetical protein